MLGEKLRKRALLAQISGLQPVIERIPKTELLVVIDYANVTLFQHFYPAYEVELLESEYAADVTYRLQLPEERIAAFITALTDLTHGQALIEPLAGEREL